MGNVINMVKDSLVSLASRMGTDRDKASTVFYTHVVLTDDQLVAAYTGSWIPRKLVDVPALDACRKWRNWQADEKQIEAIEAEEKRLNVKGKILEAYKKARLLGGAAVYIGTGDVNTALPLNVERVAKDGIKHLTVLSRRQLSAGETDRDPTSEWYGRPKHYVLSGANSQQIIIHPSRLVLFQGVMAADEDFAMGAHFGWGDSVLTSTYDAFKNADSTAKNIASLVFEAKVDVIKVPQFAANIGNKAYEDQVVRRYTVANTIKGINGTLILDAEEEYESKSAQLTGLTDILMAFLQVVSGAADIPVTRLLGQSPSGMNSTGDSDMKNYHDRIQSIQELELTPAMARLDECIIRSATGKRDAGVHFTWAPLEQMSEKEKAEIFKMKADAARALAGSNSSPALLPIEALSDALVNTFVEDGSLPGLEAAIEDYGNLAEQEDDEDDIVASVPEVPETRLVAANDAAPRTLYVRRDVLNAKQIIVWAKKQGFKSTLLANDMHVIITFSRRPVDWMDMGSTWEDEVKVPRGGARLMEKYGEARVLLFNSNMLRWRHDEMVEKGATWDHAEYQPHITISYDAESPDLTNVEPYQGEIVLGPEIFEEVKEDWMNRVSEE